MTGIALCALVAAAAWTEEVRLAAFPAERMEYAGEDAPKGAVLLGARKKATLTVDGPATLNLRLFGLMDKRGTKLRGPGAVTVQVGREKPRRIELSRTKMDTWSIPDRPRWLPGAERRHVLTLAQGTHTITLLPLRPAVLGMGLIAEVVRPIEALAGASAPPEAPPEPPPEPPDVIAPAEPPPALTQGFALTGSPADAALRGPAGNETFVQVKGGDGLQLDVVGPATMVFDIHAHRQDREPATLRPVIVGLLVDDVLIQTASIDQPLSPDYALEGAAFGLSQRATLRLPVGEGRYRVRLTVSDSAVLGASIRPRHEPAAGIEEPQLLSPDAARAADLRAQVPRIEVAGSAGLALVAAAWLPNALAQPGALAQIEGNLGVPVLGRALVGLSAGLGWSAVRKSYPDSYAAAGAGEADATLLSIPILLDVRWSAPLPAPLGVETGIGGGVVVSMSRVESEGVSPPSSTRVAPALFAHITGLWRMAGGDLLLRVAVLGARPVDADQMRGLDAGGIMAGLGYRLRLSGSE